jgi:hypothetical protein
MSQRSYFPDISTQPSYQNIDPVVRSQIEGEYTRLSDILRKKDDLAAQIKALKKQLKEKA